MSEYSRYFREAYRKFLLEKDFDISQETLDGAKKWLETETEPTSLGSLEDVDNDVETLQVVDVDAYSEDELQDDYAGKVVLECVSCHSRITVDESKVYEDSDTGTACPDIQCPVCHSELGYTILGKIEKYEAPEKEEPKVEFPEEPEEEVEEEEETEVEESLHNKIRRRALGEAKEEVCPHCGKNPCECESLEEGKDYEECGDKPVKEELDGNPARDEINGTIRNIENELDALSNRAEDAHAFSTAQAANDAYDSLESKRNSINEAEDDEFNVAPGDTDECYVEEW